MRGAVEGLWKALVLVGAGAGGRGRWWARALVGARLQRALLILGAGAKFFSLPWPPSGGTRL